MKKLIFFAVGHLNQVYPKKLLSGSVAALQSNYGGSVVALQSNNCSGLLEIVHSEMGAV